jgi:hypothetical protein
MYVPRLSATVIALIEDVLRNIYPNTRTNCWDRAGPDSPGFMMAHTSTAAAARAATTPNGRSRGGRCSVLIKPIMIDGRFDLAIAHNTWYCTSPLCIYVCVCADC